MLTQELAGVIVNKLMSVLGKNINLMDDKGYIIASGDSSRVGSFHEGAMQVIKTRQPLEIRPNDVGALQGVRPGINIPVTFEQRVMGVVGITGDPAEVRNYAELVRYTVELMLEQSSLKEKIHRQERDRDIYLHDLLSGNWHDEDSFRQRGDFVGFAMDLPRVALAIELHCPDPCSLPVEEHLHQVMGSALAALRVHAEKDNGIVGFDGATRIIYFAALSSGKDIEQQRSGLCRQAVQAAKKDTGISFVVGAGRCHPGLVGLRESYLESVEAVVLGQRFYPARDFFLIEELQTESIAGQVPAALRSAYCQEILGKLITTKGGIEAGYRRQLLETLQVYLDEDLSIKRASARLFVHRNTLMHRLKKIASLTGLDPAGFTDAFKFKLAILFYYSDME